jgi:3-hydroxybutyrate dehydrogenase
LCSLVGLTKAVALETAGSGITSNAICPGWVLTPLVQAQIDKRARETGKSAEAAKRELLLEKQPSGEFVHPEALGELAVFLSTVHAAQMTGISLPMDGGWTAQ